MTVSYGYTLSSEEHSPLDLVRNAQRAEEVGFDMRETPGLPPIEALMYTNVASAIGLVYLWIPFMLVAIFASLVHFALQSLVLVGALVGLHRVLLIAWALVAAIAILTVLAVALDPVRKVYEERPELLWGVVSMLAERVSNMDDVLADSVFLDVTGRTAKRLLELSGPDEIAPGIVCESAGGHTSSAG